MEPAASLPGGSLDALIRCLASLFVLSLAAERLTSLFKRRDWQPLSWRRTKRVASPWVDLRTKRVVGPGGSEYRVSETERSSLVRNANAENSVVAGVLLAVLLQVDALQGLVGLPAGPWGVAVHWLRILGTGLAAGIGSSFWYDLLKLLVAYRDARATPGAMPARSGAPSSLEKAEDNALDAQRARALREAASRTAAELTKEGYSVELGPALRTDKDHPGLAFFVAAGSDGAGKALLERRTVEVEVEGRKLAIPLYPSPGGSDAP